MVVAVGTDMVDARRIEALLERYGERFMSRVYTDTERAYIHSATDERRRLLRLASRFAAKEATMKVLRARGHGLRWRDIEVSRDVDGAPALRLDGQARERLAALTADPGGGVPFPRLHLSLSDEWPYALAFVVLSQP